MQDFFEKMDLITKNIIDAAENKFAQLGIRNVSIDDICNDLRISKKTFYKYYPQKENLVISVLKDLSEKNNKKFRLIHQGNNVIDALIQIIRELKKSADNVSFVFMHDLKKYYPDIYFKFKVAQRELIKGDFEENLRKGIKEGYYREDMDVELVSYFHAVQAQTVFEQMNQALPKISQKRMMDFFIDLIIRLITNEKGFEYIQRNLKDTN